MCEYKVAAVSFKWRGCLKKLLLIVEIVTDRYPSYIQDCGMLNQKNKVRFP